MEETKLTLLKKELKLKEFQFNSIFEFSESIYSSFKVDNIMRIYFSTLMTQMGITRAFLFYSQHNLFKSRGFRLTDSEQKKIKEWIQELEINWLELDVEDITPQLSELKELLTEKKIKYLVNVSESEKKRNIIGLGARFNNDRFSNEKFEFAYFVSKFALSALENAFLINKLIETKRLEHEIKIARDIQQSLLPQDVPTLENFEVAVIYQPINEVGGDYYDILKEHDGMLPILIADVEGKGLSAALLAASSQAIFHSLNELYFFEPGKFISKANALIYDFTKGKRFITLFWMLVDDPAKTVTYVNAGHASPFLISAKDGSVSKLTTGGFLTGFVEEAEYEKETVCLESGDIIVAFTDGVPEVENRAAEEFGEEGIINYIQKHGNMPVNDLIKSLAKTITDFSEKVKFRDDFTLLILKVK